MLAFLQLASGFNIALAICNIPTLREQLIRDAREDATKFGVNVVAVKLSGDSSIDFAAAVRKSLGEHANRERLAVMIVGVDELIYQPGDEQTLTSDLRPAFVARLNLDRERIANELPYPLVLWAERETATLLLSKAPDLSQWISARFDFAGLEPPFAQIAKSEQHAMEQPADRTEADIAEFKALLDQLAKVPRTEDPVTLRTRLAILNTLGDRFMRVSYFARARDTWAEALAIARKLDNARGEAAALANLCTAYYVMGNYNRAIEYCTPALKIAREIGDRLGEETTLGNLGLALRALGENRRAIEHYQQALRIAQEIGDRRGAGNALGNLGSAYNALGERHKAIEYHEQALGIAREIGDRRGELNGLGNLGNTYGALGEYHKAIGYSEQALQIAREIGDRFREGNAFGNLGNTYNALGEHRRAIEFHERYLNIAREIGDRRGEGNALGNLGNAYQALGEYRRAAEYQEQNLRVARGIGDLRGEGNAHWNLSQALIRLGDRRQAVDHAEAALKIFDQVESPFAATARTHLAAWLSGQNEGGLPLKH